LRWSRPRASRRTACAVLLSMRNYSLILSMRNYSLILRSALLRASRRMRPA